MFIPHVMFDIFLPTLWSNYVKIYSTLSLFSDWSVVNLQMSPSLNEVHQQNTSSWKAQNYKK